MTDKQKQTMSRVIGVLEGLAWIALTDEKLHVINEALESVVAMLEALLKEDEHD